LTHASAALGQAWPICLPGCVWADYWIEALQAFRVTYRQPHHVALAALQPLSKAGNQLPLAGIEPDAENHKSPHPTPPKDWLQAEPFDLEPV
jgi:hypothetical protein